MNNQASSESNEFRSPKSGRKNPLGKRSAGGIAVVALVAAYSFAQPKLNERFGWNLPGLKQNHRGEVVVDNRDATPQSRTQPKINESFAPKMQPPETKGTASSKPKPSASNATKSASSGTKKPSTRESGPLANRKTGPLASRMSAGKKSDNGKADNNSKADDDLLYGLLRETSPDRYISPQGLQYTPGSAEGHRLEHLRRHTKDIPNRPGSHGVFDGGMEGALKTIDRAYERAKKKQGNTISRKEKGRTIYTVDMGRAVGYVGGRTGKQRRNPKVRRVQLVLEGTRVITAYPK